MEGKDEEGDEAQAGIQPGTSGLLAVILSAVKFVELEVRAQATAHGLKDDFTEDGGSDKTDAHQDEGNELPDVVQLTDAPLVLENAEKNQGNVVGKVSSDGSHVAGADGADEADSFEDTEGDNATAKRAAAHAGGWLVVSVDTHICFCQIYI